MATKFKPQMNATSTRRAAERAGMEAILRDVTVKSE